MRKVVIVGGGFGGLAAANELKGADVAVTLIDRRNHHLFQPLLYQVATAVLDPSAIAWAIRQLVRRRPEVTTILGTVVGVDTTARAVVLETRMAIEYDYLLIATGARHAYFGHDAWEAFAPGLKTIEDATAIRRRLLMAFEQAELEPDPHRRRALLTFTIIGAGPTGVELAGAIIELARVTLKGNFRAICPEDARVVLIEAGARVLSGFRPEMSAYAERALKELGVEVELGRPVTAIRAGEVDYGGATLHTGTVLWAAGVLASPAAEWLDAAADRAGRIFVNANLSIPGHPDIFAVGDTVAAMDTNGMPVPGIGDAAKQGGRHAARMIKARMHGEAADLPFRYRHLGDIATVGRSRALIDFGRVRITGRLAWWIWGLAHIYFLIGLRNRLFIALNWLWTYLTAARNARLITRQGADTGTAPGRPSESGSGSDGQTALTGAERRRPTDRRPDP